MREAPIGVFDSGVGGLSVLAEIQRLLPDETLLYVADCGISLTARKPWNDPPALQRHGRVLQRQGAKALVLACDTATVAGVADLRRDYPQWPIVGMEPAVKPAAAATRSGVVGVLATTGTLQSAKFAALLDRFATDVRVITQPCPGLVELIEKRRSPQSRVAPAAGTLCPGHCLPKAPIPSFWDALIIRFSSRC